jgi:uncharacterized membrane protein
MDEHLAQCLAMMQEATGHAATAMSGVMPMGGGMGMAMLVVGLVLVALAFGAGAATGRLAARPREPRDSADARRVLDSRYAAGELDRDTYLRMRADLAYEAAGSG